MSKEIEERVVKISLDNSGFEKKANRTANTLDEIDEKMKFKDASKGFKDVEKAANSVKMSGLLTVLDTAKHKFTSLEVAAITAISNISNRAVDAGVNLVKSLSLDQITEGYSKYEQKTAGVQTIMNATGKSINEVTKSLEKLNWFTDETSYNFVDMVSNIGKFTSVGVDLDDAVTAMEGIANVAAISGQGINEASRAMYNFAQALGTGSVKLIDWKSIENANMATKEFKETIIDIALEEGTLVKSSDGLIKTLEGSEVSVLDFSSALKDQWFNSNVLIKTLGRYGEYADEVYNKVTETGLQCAEAMELVNGETMDLGERAFKAAQEAKTFTDALNATKDAVSTGWMSTFEILFGNYEEAKEVWTELSGDLWDIFAASGAARNELLGEAFNSGSGWDVLVEKIESAGIGINNFETDLAELAKNEGRNVDALIAEHETLENAIKSGALSDLIPTLFKKYTDGAEDATSSTKDLYSIFREYQNLVNQITKGEFGNDEEQLQTIKDLGYDVAFVQGLVNKAIQGGTVSVEDFSDAQMKAEGYTDEQIAALRELADTANQTGTELNDAINNLDGLSTREIFIDSFRNVIVSLKSVLDTVKNAWEDVFPAWTVENIRDLVKNFHDFTSNLKPTEQQLETVRSVAKGLFSVLSILKQTVVALVQNGFNLLKRILNYFGIDIGSTAASVGELVYQFDQWLKEGNKINSSISTTINFIMSMADAVKNVISNIVDLPLVKDVINNLSNSFSATNGRIKDSAESITEVISNLWDSLKGMASNINPLSIFFVASGLAILMLVKNFVGISNKFITAADSITNSIKKVLGSLSDFLKAPAFKNISDGVLTLSTSVAILAGSYLLLSKVPSENVVQAGVALSVLIAEVAGLALLLKSISKVEGIREDNIEQFQKLIKSVFSALTIFAVGVLAASAIPGAKVESLTITIVGAIAMTTLFSKLLKTINGFTAIKADKVKQVKQIIKSVFGALTVFFTSVIVASSISGAKVESLTSIVSGAIAMIGLFTPLLKTINNLTGLEEDKVKQVIKLFALINLILGGLSVVVSAAAMIPSKWQNIAAIFAGASVALLAISQSFMMLSGVQPLEDGVIVQLFGLATVAALIGGLITAISSLAGDTVNIANLLTVTVATGALILALSASVRILNGVPAQKIQAAGTIAIELVALVGAMVAIMAAMKLLNPVHTDGLIIKVAAVSLAITTLVGVAALIAVLSAPLSAALPVILPAIGTIAIVAGAITAIALVLGLLVAGLGAIDNAIGGGLSDSFATGMEMIGYGIGRFSASIEEAKLASLPIEGQYLSEFAQSSADFFAALQYMDTDKLEMLTKLPKALKKLSKMDIDDEDSETMATNLSAYGSALINFTTSVGSYNADMVKSVELACEAGNMLADHLDNVPNFSGALAKVLGDNTWTDFYVGLEYYGECLVNYGNTMLSHMSSKMVKAIELSVDAGKNLAALLDAVPNTGGALAAVLGDNTWWDFASGLVNFGSSLRDFGVYANDIAPNIGSIEQTVRVGYALSELLKAVPKEEAGWFKSWFGDKHEYSAIYTGLVEFGKQMAEFGRTVSPIDANTVTKMKLISEAAKNLGYAMQAVKDVKSKGDYGGYTKIVEGLTEFATAIVNFSNDTSELKLSSFQKVKKSIDILLEVVSEDNCDAITKNLPKIGKKLKQYGDDLQDFQDKIAGLDYTAFEMAFSVGTGEVKQRKTGREIIDGKIYDYDQEETFDLDDMITDPEEIKKFKELEASVWEDDTTVTDAAYAAGSATGESYLSGFDDATGINSPSKEMAIRAGYMVEGLAYGLTDRQRQIADSGAYMAGTFLTTFNDVLGIHSPSKEVYEAAKHVVEGFVIGVDEGKSRLAEKSQELGSTVLEHLGLEDIANSVKSGGGDIGTLLVDAIKSKTGFDVTELTNSFSDIGTDLADSLGSSFNDTLSSITGGTDIIQDETLEKAKSEYDVLLNELKAGSISAARYEEDYTKLVQKYSATQSEAYNSALNEVNRLTEGVEYYQKLVDESTDKKSDVYKNNSETLKEYKSALKSAKKELESFSETSSKSNIVLQLQTYSKEQLTEYVNESVSTLQEKYEATIGEIQSKMDGMSTNFGKTYDDMITYTTNKDVYDKKVTDYEKRIDGVNRKLDESKRKYGENSTQAKRYESQLESLELELQSYKDFYEREEFKDDEIVGIEWSNNLLKETEKLTKYTDEMAKLSERGVSQTFIDYIASQDIDKALATLEWANSQTDKELKKQDKMFTDHEEALKMAKRTTYAGAIDQAEKELQNGMVFLHETLPESAKDIGSEIISNLSASFSEETEKTLSVFGKAGTDIIKAIKLGLGFGELEQEETLSEAMAETGRKTADSQAKGYTDQMASNAASMAQTNAEIQTDVANAGIDAAVKAVEDNGYKIADAYKSTYQMAAEEYAKQEQERQLQQHYDEKDAKNRGAMASWSGYTPTITPQTVAQNAKVISAYTARSMAASINAARALANRAGELPLNTQTDGSNAVVTVVQNNYSPQELTRSDIRNRYRDVMAIANSGY